MTKIDIIIFLERRNALLLYEYGINKKQLDATWAQDVTCVQHLHHNIEVVLVKSGVLYMTLNKEELTLQAGEAVLIAPYTLHSFIYRTSHTVCILEYPPEYTPQFFDFLKKYQSEHPVIRMHKALQSYLWHMLPLSKTREHIPLIRAQAILMPLCEAFSTQCTFTVAEERFSDSFICAMRLVSCNFQKPITLSGIAAQVGVRKETLIRLFRRQTGTTFWDYVLILRTMYAITLMQRKKSLTEVAYDAGFGSIRSFNRVFRDKTGMSPTEYILQKKQGDIYFCASEFSWMEESDGIAE